MSAAEAAPLVRRWEGIQGTLREQKQLDDCLLSAYYVLVLRGGGSEWQSCGRLPFQPPCYRSTLVSGRSWRDPGS